MWGNKQLICSFDLKSDEGKKNLMQNWSEQVSLVNPYSHTA